MKDAIKEEIGFFKLLFTIFTAIDVSLVAWLSKHYATSNLIILTMAIIGVTLVTMVISYSLFKIITKIKLLATL